MEKNENEKKFKSLESFSKYINIPAKDLVEAFEVEQEFHEKILKESSKEARLKLYDDVYNKVHPIYERSIEPSSAGNQLISRRARLFHREVSGKSILEVGCGSGAFLISVLRRDATNKELCGLDVTIPGPKVASEFKEINFIKADITEFEVKNKFDVVYSNHVFEHIAPADTHTHILSIKNALNKSGTLIINAPNKFFGPSDVTRIIDFSYNNKINAQGTHLNEPSYSELIELLKGYGFTNFRTTLPGLIARNIFPNIRMKASIFSSLESKSKLIDILHKIKFQGRCLVAFEVTIICDAP